MKTTSALIAVAAAAAGTVGAAWAYDEAAPPVGNPSVASADTAVTRPVAQRPRFVWAPCRPPAELRDGACVTDVVRTVVLPAPPEQATPLPPTPVAEQDDDAPDEADDDHADDDHADDDREDEDREDHGDEGGDDDDHEDDEDD